MYVWLRMYNMHTAKIGTERSRQSLNFMCIPLRMCTMKLIFVIRITPTSIRLDVQPTKNIKTANINKKTMRVVIIIMVEVYYGIQVPFKS